jgi:DNA-binding NarL/FixJ family response regulator
MSGVSGVSMPVTRPTGRALIIGAPACRANPLNTLQRLGFTCAEVDDPYSAMAEISRRPLVYRAMILSLASLYREELAIVQSVKRRWPHLEIWLTQTDGRHAALADAMRLGADGLLSDDGLHRTAVTGGATDTVSPASHSPTVLAATLQLRSQPQPMPPNDDGGASQEAEGAATEPILTADELRALLAEQPAMPPGGEG